jgi:signal transduction histidine kinase
MTEAALEAARSGLSGEEMRSIDLAALADSVCDDLSAQGHDARCDAREPLVVMCRPNEIRRALRNLIENAIKYGRFARVQVRRSNGHAVVSVEDEGP